MKQTILMFMFMAVAGAQQPVEPPSASTSTCATVNGDGTLSWKECSGSALGSGPMTSTPSINTLPYYSIGNSGTISSGAPANEVLMQPLEHGGTYEGKAAKIHIFAKHPEVHGFLVAVETKVNADFAILEVLYREKWMVDDHDTGHTLFRTKTQVVRVFRGGMSMADEVNLPLEEVEKINVRLVSESNVVEFWSDTSEIKKK